MLSKQRIILYVDDDADDQLLILETIREISKEVRVACAINGVEALRYLEQAKHNGQEFPALILMDINMPLLNGKEVLVTLKKDPVLKHIPVVMFTTSSTEEDRSFCLASGAADFVTKPFSHEALHSIVYRFLKFIGVQ